MFAKGYNGQIRIEGDWLSIERKGLGHLGHSKGDKRIALGQIVAVKMRPAGPVANGFIHFSTSGGDELRGGLNEATRNDNAVIFRRGSQTEFNAVREHVENYIAARSRPSPAVAAPAPLDPADQLRKFAQLRDEGIVSEEEFQAKKAELLGRDSSQRASWKRTAQRVSRKQTISARESLPFIASGQGWTACNSRRRPGRLPRRLTRS